MLSLNTLRTKFGVILSVVIGGALLAFILSLKTEMGFSENNPAVGEINGEDVSYSEFLNAYEETKLLMGGENADYSQSIQMINATWQSLVSEKVFTPDFEKLGLSVGEAEFNAILNGDIQSAILVSIFGNPQTGTFNPAALNAFLAQAEGNPQVSKVWSLLQKQIRFERAMNKYSDLVRGGEYANTLTVNKNLPIVNNTYNGHFVSCKYYSVADSLVSVSKSEMKSYYNENKAKFKQTPYRTISYAVFDIEASAEDALNIEKEAKAAGKEFAKAADLKTYSRKNRHASVAQTFVAAKSLKSDEATALRAQRTYGPVLQGNEWYASRAVEVRNAPEYIELQHIVLNYNEAKKADEVLKEARKGTSFKALAEKYSVSDSFDLGKVQYSELAQEFADAFRNARRGAIVKVEAGSAIQIFKVLSVGSIQRHYRLATLTYGIEPSSATKGAIHSEASLFSVEASAKGKKFEEVASAKSVMTSSTDIERGSRELDGLENSVEVVRWANEAEVGDVSELFKLDNCYVVATLTEINDDEYKPFEKVEAQIKNTLLKDKKFELLKAKMTGATLEEIAQNAGAKVEEFKEAKASSYYIRNIGPEPQVAGVLATVGEEQKGTVLPIVKGSNGAYVLVVDEIVVEKEPQTAQAERVKVQAQIEAMAPQRAMWAIQQMADIEDNSVKFF